MESETPPITPSTRWIWLGVALIAFSALWAYRHSFRGPFLFDDIRNIQENRVLDQFFPDRSELPYGLRQRPIGHASFALNYAVHERRHGGYHVTNLAIHIAAGLILFGLVRRTLELPSFAGRFAKSATGLATAAALIWTLHPLQTQAVTYTVQRVESLMGLFYLLCLYCVLRGSQSQRAWLWYLPAIASFWLGLGTKEVIATGLLVIPLFDRAYLASSWKEVIRRRGAVYAGFALAIGWLAWYIVSLRTAPGAATAEGFELEDLTPWQYLRTQPEVIFYYLRLAAWPKELCLDYLWPIAPESTATYLRGVALLSIVLASLIAYWKSPKVGFLGLAFFLILSPTSSILPIADLAVEHRMYLSLAPLVVGVVLLFHELLQRLLRDESTRKAVSLGTQAFVVVWLTARTSERNRDYANPLEMWRLVAVAAPHNYRAVYNVARYEDEASRRDDADSAKLSQAAESHYRATLELKPDYARAYNGLASVLARRGDYSAATKAYESALRLEPRSAQFCDNFGNLYARQEKWDEAIVLFKKAIELNRGYMPAYLHLGIALDKSGQPSDAADVFRDALKIEPRLSAVARELAWLLATSPHAGVRNGAEAVRWSEGLKQALPGNDFRTPDIQAAAFAENGQFDEAVAAAERARDQAAAAGQMKAADEVGQRLALYRAHKPYRQTISQNADKPIKPASAETIAPAGT